MPLYNTSTSSRDGHHLSKASKLTSLLSVVLMKVRFVLLLVVLLGSATATEGVGDPEYYAQFNTCTTDDDCLNGGTCHKNAQTSIGHPDMCACLLPFHGEHCENAYCHLDCQAGGVCKVFPTELSWREVCDCPDDRLGNLCQYDANDPLAELHACHDDDDCRNGGHCRDPAYEFEVLRFCDCEPGYTGNTCEHVVEVETPSSGEDPTTDNDVKPPSSPSPDDPTTPDRGDPSFVDDNSKNLPPGAKIGLALGATLSVVFVLLWLTLSAKKRLCSTHHSSKAVDEDGDGLHRESTDSVPGVDPENQEGGTMAEENNSTQVIENPKDEDKVEDLPDVI